MAEHALAATDLATKGRVLVVDDDASLAEMLTIVLRQDDAPAFTATLIGRRVGPATPARVLGYALSLLPHRARFLIQRHGVLLWLRGLPVVPRRAAR